MLPTIQSVFVFIVYSLYFSSCIAIIPFMGHAAWIKPDDDDCDL